MSSQGSITRWIDQLKAGEQAAAQQLWERYFQRLVGLARKKLKVQAVSRRAADEEDVALSAFASLCQGVEHGQFPDLFDRDNLWRLLVTITARKALQLARYEHRQKRDSGAVLGESAVAGHPEAVAVVDADLGKVLSREPSPEFLAQMTEECNRLLDRLEKTELRSIALWKMEGHTIEEIATRLGRAPRTVVRKLQVIRTLWENEGTV